MELADHFIVVAQGLIHQLAEAVGVFIQHLGALLEGQALRAVASVIGDVAGGLVAQKVNVDIFLIEVLQQIHHVAVIGDGAGSFFGHVLLRHGEGLVQARGLLTDPALGVAGHDAGHIDLGDDGDGAGNFCGLTLGAAHAAKTGGDEQAAGQILIVGNAQLQTARVEQGVERTVDNALRPDVHPAAGGHLAVVGDAQSGGAVKVLLVIKHADHQAVGDNAAGSALVGVEQSQRVTAHDHQRLLVGQHFQILLDETVLHPVLADLTGLAVGHQLVGVQGHVKVQVILDHHLEGLALDAAALVLVNGLAGQAALGTEAIAVDPAVFLQLLCKFLGHLGVVVGMDVPQGVADGQLLVGLGEMGFPAGSPANTLFKGGVLRQVVVQLYCHSLVNIENRHGRSS
ncbi:hypothetical protein SDC9_103827 [bioreactor metagenome]|uniref:NAD-specific glutamate dehydrogenase n=1 Tax=bioreactor metagenome TaxID=1076179 RepID=A0A645AV46_9ZZZZ